MRKRWLAAGGLIGPASFISAWSILGATRNDYSPVADAISELARVSTSSRPWMTAGMLGFTAGMIAFSAALDETDRRAAAVALTSAVTTAGVACTPLGSSLEPAHFVFAGAAYLSLAALPVVGSQSFSKPIVAYATGVAVAASLIASVVGDVDTHGFWQRAGLTIADVWIAANAIRLLRR